MKKVFSILLMVALFVSMLPLAALATEPAVAAAGASPAHLVAFENRVSITVPVYDRSKEGYPPVDDNYWTQWVQKEFGDKYNIDVKYVAIPRGDVMTKYNLLIAGGETPTIMMEYDYPKVAQWANDGAMQEINLEEFAAVAPTFYQAMVDNNQLSYTAIGGKDYFVLTERPYYNTPFTYVEFMRKDWLDQLGLEVPKSYEEFVKVVKAVQEAGLAEHPVGLQLPKAAYVANFGFRNYPVDEAEWAMHSSLGTASLTWYATERLLRRQNAEYNQGFFSTEYELEDAGASGGSSQWQTDFINGKKLYFGGYIAANMEFLRAFYEANPTAQLVVVNPYRTVEAGVSDYPQLRADNPFGMIVGFSSLATPEQLKAAWMYMEWMIQPETLAVIENGVENVTYTLDASGRPVVNGDYRGTEMLNHNMNIDMTCVVHASKKVGTAEETIAALAPQGLPQDFTQELIDNYNIQKEIASKGWAYSDPVFAVAIEAESEFTASLLSLYQEYSVALTKCKPEEFDALYAELCKKYLEAGYQQIIDERKAAYDAGNTTKLPVAP